MDRKTLEAKLIRLGSLEVNIFRENWAMRDPSALETEVDKLREEILDAFDIQSQSPISRIRREQIQDMLVEVKKAGYQIIATGSHEEGKPIQSCWQVNDPDGVPLPTLYKHRTRAITGAFKHLQKQEQSNESES